MTDSQSPCTGNLRLAKVKVYACAKEQSQRSYSSGITSQTNKWSDRQTNGRYQVYFKELTLCFQKCIISRFHWLSRKGKMSVIVCLFACLAMCQEFRGRPHASRNTKMCFWGMRLRILQCRVFIWRGSTVFPLFHNSLLDAAVRWGPFIAYISRILDNTRSLPMTHIPRSLYVFSSVHFTVNVPVNAPKCSTKWIDKKYLFALCGLIKI